MTLAFPQFPMIWKKQKSLLEEAGWVDTNGDGIREKEIDGQKLILNFRSPFLVHPKNTKPLVIFLKKTFRKLVLNLNVQPTEWSMLLKKWIPKSLMRSP